MSKMGWSGQVFDHPAAEDFPDADTVWERVAAKTVLIYHKRDEVLPYNHCR
jgi:hypothetical protein